ncbi:hypothetical protein [Nocardiopsis sp. LOL_012]|uniref:hypothetical protein n=1 Tax=Nocardiopsis sp. LOL_012 TaxID=3345409 RepID=UPI003A868D8F
MELLRDPDPGRAQRATRAMMGMHRIDVAKLRRAADAGGRRAPPAHAVVPPPPSAHVLAASPGPGPENYRVHHER